MMTAKRYDLAVGRYTLRDLSETEVTELFRHGHVSERTACRLGGHTEWQELNEYLPLLKYEIVTSEDTDSDERLSPSADEVHASSMTQWKLGMSCFAAGLLFAGAATTLPKTVFSPDKSPQRRIAILRAEPLEASSDPRVISRRVQGTPVAQPWAGSTLRNNTPPDTTASLPGTPRIPIGPEEASIPLQKWTTVRSSFGSFRIKVRKDGPGTISVWYDHSNEPRRFEKKNVSEAYGTNVVQIHSLPGAKVYYVDRLTAPVGRCVLKVIPDAWSG